MFNRTGRIVFWTWTPLELLVAYAFYNSSAYARNGQTYYKAFVTALQTICNSITKYL